MTDHEQGNERTYNIIESHCNAIRDIKAIQGHGHNTNQ